MLWLASLHLGPLHPVEQGITLALAFGPLLLLALTIWVSRRRSARDSDRPTPQGRPGE